MKIYQLAKEFEVSSLVLVEIARSWGAVVRNHMSRLEPDLEFRFRNHFLRYKNFGNGVNLFHKKSILRKNKKNIATSTVPDAKFSTLLPAYIWEEVRFRSQVAQANGGWKFEAEMEFFYQIKIVKEEAA